MGKASHPVEDELLGREAFRTAVLDRSRQRCVLCGRPALDAHHILERKLFSDGGYYLANGAAVCADCHLDCETTRVPVERVRAAAGIARAVLPPGFSADDKFDKWGNRVRADGLREPGPLFDDEGCRRALAAGGFLGHFVPAGSP